MSVIMIVHVAEDKRRRGMYYRELGVRRHHPWKYVPPAPNNKMTR
jgi:hypothetical protein